MDRRKKKMFSILLSEDKIIDALVKIEMADKIYQEKGRPDYFEADDIAIEMMYSYRDLLLSSGIYEALSKQKEPEMTVDKLIAGYKEHNPGGHFFDNDTLKWFGETIRTMRILEDTKIVEGRECYVLSSRQKKYPTGPRTQHYYFAKDDFEYMGAKG